MCRRCASGTSDPCEPYGYSALPAGAVARGHRSEIAALGGHSVVDALALQRSGWPIFWTLLPEVGGARGRVCNKSLVFT